MKHFSRLSLIVLALFFTMVIAFAQIPVPWTAQDIGAPTVAGSTTVTAGVFTVTGAGIDIWNTSDQFQYVSQPMTGDGEIVARVMSLVNTDPSARAGVMIREDLTADAPNVMVHAIASGLLRSTSRTTRAGVTTGITTPVTAALPYWVRLTRVGNVFTAYTSATGTNWIVLNTVTVPMAMNVVAGLAVNSLVPATATTGVFSNVTVTQTVSSAIPITATSQLQWEEIAASLPAALGYAYTPYVDGVKRVALPGVTCAVTPLIAGSFTCQALVPVSALTMGIHTIDISTNDTALGLESSRSNPVLASFSVVVAPTAPTNLRLVR